MGLGQARIEQIAEQAMAARLDVAIVDARLPPQVVGRLGGANLKDRLVALAALAPTVGEPPLGVALAALCDALAPRQPQVALALDRDRRALLIDAIGACPPLQARPLPTLGAATEPFPVLQPIDDPRLLGGRAQDVADLVGRLGPEGPPILALHAPSGYGKSSLVQAGLLWALRGLDRPVALDRAPQRPGLTQRLLEGLLGTGALGTWAEQVADPTVFAAWILVIAAQHGPPVLVLDQVEDLFKAPPDGAEVRRIRAARAALGHLLAATHGLPCRWVLSLRHEAMGALERWLRAPFGDGDALAAAQSPPPDPDGPGLRPPGEWEVPLKPVRGDGFREALDAPLAACVAAPGRAGRG